MRFTLRHLEYFVMVAEMGTLTRASDHLRISAPSISSAISHLEKELKVQLFVRHHAKGVSITPEGREILVEAKLILEHAQNLPSLAGDLNEQISGPMAIGAMTTLAAIIVPQLAGEFVKKYPNIRLSFHEAAQDELMQKLFNAEITHALTYDIGVPGDMRFIKLAELPTQVLLCEGHRLAAQESITLHELAKDPYVLLDIPISYEYFMAIFKANGVKPKVEFRSPHIDFVRSTVANGFGYSLINTHPQSNRSLDGKKLVAVPLVDKHPPIQLGLVRIHKPYVTRAQKAFETFCKEKITQKSIPGAVI